MSANPSQQQYYLPNQGQQQQNYQQQGHAQQINSQQDYPMQNGQNRQVNPQQQQQQQGIELQQAYLQEQSYQQMPQNLDNSTFTYVIDDQQHPNNGGGQINIGGIMSIIGSLPAVQIRQVLEYQAKCGNSIQNTFLVWSADAQGQQTGTQPMLRLKEHTDCLDRVCLHRDCRPYQLFSYTFSGMLTIKNQNIYADNSKQNFRMDRPCAFTFYCLNRPFIDIFHTQGGQNIFIGKIVAPFQLLKHGVNIYDKNNDLMYVVEASCFEPQFWCNLPCESCQTCKFGVFDKNRQLLTEIVKYSTCCCKVNDSFRVIFPRAASAEQKVLLMAAALFLEYRFENGYGIRILADVLVDVLCSMIC